MSGDKEQQKINMQELNLTYAKTIIVDSDEKNVSFIKDILVSCGAKCDTALSAEEALNLVDLNNSYDIYFIKMELPGMEGIILTKIVKSKENNPDDVSVIMYSASGGITDAEMKKASVDKFLSMPLSVSAIIDSIKSCLYI